jgi:peptidoglycan hydrolase-like protein with peptidoglycan-binding domain
MRRSWFSTIVVLGMATGFSGGTVAAAELPVDDVREMEQLLAQLNFDPGAIDGVVDDRTRTAIRLYQEFAVLPVDGEPSDRLLSELRQVSKVYAEMREASPPVKEPVANPVAETAAETETAAAAPANPEPAIANTAAPDPAPATETDGTDTLPETVPKAPEPPAAAETPAAETPAAETPAAETPAAETPAVAPEIADTESIEPAPSESVSAETQTAKLEPEAEAVEPAAEAAPPAPAAEPKPEPAVAAPMTPEPKPAVATSPPTVAEPQPEAAPKAAEAPAAPKAEAGFNLTGMIARLKKRDAAAAPATATQTAHATPTVTTDRASYERTLIWKVQHELQRIGLDPGAADGNMRKRTTSAIETYQRARGLPADGRVTEELLARLKVEVPPSGRAAPQSQSTAAPLSTVAPQAASIGIVPSNGYQAFNAGFSAAQTGDYGAAVKLYDQAIDGGDLSLEHLATALYNRANAYQYLGVLDKAIEDYSAAIANKPSFPAAYYNRGFAFDMKGEKARAVEDFRRARDLGLQRLGVRSPDLPPPRL